MGMNKYKSFDLRTYVLIVPLLFLLSTSVLGQSRLSINPGIKLGLAFGEKVQFIFGYELSVVFYSRRQNENHRFGIVLDYDTIDDIKRLHVGLEYMYRVVGIDIGPVFAWKGSKPYYGYSIIPFGGALLLPYFNYTHLEGIDDQFDFGTYLKIPIPLQKEISSLGG